MACPTGAVYDHAWMESSSAFNDASQPTTDSASKSLKIEQSLYVLSTVFGTNLCGSEELDDGTRAFDNQVMTFS